VGLSFEVQLVVMHAKGGRGGDKKRIRIRKGREIGRRGVRIDERARVVTQRPYPHLFVHDGAPLQIGAR